MSKYKGVHKYKQVWDDIRVGDVERKSAKERWK